jgi:hypothetical protein
MWRRIQDDETPSSARDLFTALAGQEPQWRQAPVSFLAPAKDSRREIHIVANLELAKKVDQTKGGWQRVPTRQRKRLPWALWLYSKRRYIRHRCRPEDGSLWARLSNELCPRTYDRRNTAEAVILTP